VHHVREVAAAWRARAASEAAAADTFRSIALALEGTPLRAKAEEAVADELRHAKMCWSLASRIDGDSKAWTPSPSREVKRAPLEVIVGACCVSETLGSAVLRDTLEEDLHDVVRPVVEALLQDELRHAQLGWAVLGSVDADARRRVSAALPKIVNGALDAWRVRIDAQPRPYPRYGLPGVQRLEASVRSALAGIVRPGLSRLGLETQGLREAV